jgi:hypothetical protein
VQDFAFNRGLAELQNPGRSGGNMAYIDEALKLDVRSLMALAMKGGKKSAYSITISCQTGQVICRDLRHSQTGLPRRPSR